MIGVFRPRSPFDRLIRLAQGGARLLDPAARQEIAGFVLAQQQPDGGFRGPAGGSDLYYTLFSLAGLRALETPSPGVAPWLSGFGDGAGLDLVHLAALAVCQGAFGGDPTAAWRQRLVARLETFRQPDGGFADEAGCEHGTPYGGYLAALAANALGIRLPRRPQVVAAARRCQARDGGYAGRPGAPVGTVPATVAALILLALAWHRPAKATVAWFERCRRGPVFAAAPDAPFADLLSTATVLAANRLLRLRLPIAKRPAATFVESCWHETGGFAAIPAAHPDAEYAFYALLALGCLS